MKNIFSLTLSVEINSFDSEKYFCTDESVKIQFTGSISENFTNSYLESTYPQILKTKFYVLWSYGHSHVETGPNCLCEQLVPISTCFSLN